MIDSDKLFLKEQYLSIWLTGVIKNVLPRFILMLIKCKHSQK
jgi:hypothetical protein